MCGEFRVEAKDFSNLSVPVFPVVPSRQLPVLMGDLFRHKDIRKLPIRCEKPVF
jgi:hypothetical protein